METEQRSFDYILKRLIEVISSLQMADSFNVKIFNKTKMKK